MKRQMKHISNLILVFPVTTFYKFSMPWNSSFPGIVGWSGDSNFQVRVTETGKYPLIALKYKFILIYLCLGRRH